MIRHCCPCRLLMRNVGSMALGNCLSAAALKCQAIAISLMGNSCAFSLLSHSAAAYGKDLP